jgi:membrane protein implicated in regulation of membrane protease activity
MGNALQSLWSFVSVWHNLPFSLLLMVSVLLSVLQLIGLGGDQDADADTDLDADADADMDADAGMDATPDGFLAALAFLGVGKAPLAVILAILTGAIGLTGWLLNAVLAGALGGIGALAFAGVLLVSLILGGLITARLSRAIGRALPPVISTATTQQALVGRMGTVVSPSIDSTYGMVRLRDKGGTMINVFAIPDSSDPDAQEALRQGENVMLTSYDVDNNRYAVRSTKRRANSN